MRIIYIPYDLSKMEFDQEQRKQIAEAIKESMTIIEYCLHKNKLSGLQSDDYSKSCYGYPAAILLFSIIDTIGSFFRGSQLRINVDSKERKISGTNDHLLILNHKRMFDLDLTEITIKDLYSTYRCKLTHNHALPFSNYLINCSQTDWIFKYNNEGKIVCINLAKLHTKVHAAVEKFEHYLISATWSDNHELTKELLEAGKSETSGDIISIPASGIPTPEPK